MNQEDSNEADQQPEDVERAERVVDAAVRGAWKHHDWLLNYLDLPFQPMGEPQYGARLLIGSDGSVAFAFDADAEVEISGRQVAADLAWVIGQIANGSVAGQSK